MVERTRRMANDSIGLISEVLEKMIDNQTTVTRAITTMQNACTVTQTQSNAILEHFRNGFRLEIKEHINQAQIEILKETKKSCEEHQKKITELNQRIEEVHATIKSFKSIGFWAKLIVAFIVSFGTIIYSTSRIMQSVYPPEQTQQISQE
jgi:vacuolar-type H+-ATPase subunit H